MPSLIRVGPLAVAVESDGANWASALATRYGAFAIDEVASPDFELRLVARSEAPSIEALASLHAEPVEVAAQGDRWAFTAPSFCGSLDFGRRRAEVSGPLHRHAVDFALRLLLASEVAGGMLVHGALLGSSDGAWLCAGPSGAGKTTLGRLFPEAALCDELTFLRREDGGSWSAFATPFWRGRPVSAPLRAVRWIRHGSCDRLTRLTSSETLRRLAPEVRWPLGGEAQAATLGRLLRLIAEIEVAELAFRPTTGVWNVLEGRVA